MAKIILATDGQSFELPDAVAADDNLLLKTLSSTDPALANAEIKRKTENDVMVVTVSKRAGTKGGPVEDLIAAPESINPSLTALIRINKGNPNGLPIVVAQYADFATKQELEKSRIWERDINRMKSQLIASAGVPSKTTPTGF